MQIAGRTNSSSCFVVKSTFWLFQVVESLRLERLVLVSLYGGALFSRSSIWQTSTNMVTNWGACICEKKAREILVWRELITHHGFMANKEICCIEESNMLKGTAFLLRGRFFLSRYWIVQDGLLTIIFQSAWLFYHISFVKLYSAMGNFINRRF